MSFESTLKALNQMVKDAIVADYVIGGAVGALFYTEPFPTDDLDIFVEFIDPQPLIVTLEPIYQYLKAKGYRLEDEHVIVEGMPVQILPVHGALVAEAARMARKKLVGSEAVRVMRAEHLLALMASLARPKDKARIPLVLSQAKIDRKLLKEVLSRYGLLDKWKKIVR